MTETRLTTVWERLDNGGNVCTERLAVPGGWLVRSRTISVEFGPPRQKHCRGRDANVHCRRRRHLGEARREDGEAVNINQRIGLLALLLAVGILTTVILSMSYFALRDQRYQEYLVGLCVDRGGLPTMLLEKYHNCEVQR